MADAEAWIEYYESKYDESRLRQPCAREGCGGAGEYWVDGEYICWPCYDKETKGTDDAADEEGD